jgi:hypothetical protein
MISKRKEPLWLRAVPWIIAVVFLLSLVAIVIGAIGLATTDWNHVAHDAGKLSKSFHDGAAN